MDTNNKEREIPAEILEAIKSSRVYLKLEEIGERYNLLLDQVGQLEVDTRMVMVGNLESEKFIETMAKNLEISMGMASKIASDINIEVFVPLRESLRKTQGTVEQSQPTPPPPQNPSLSPLEKAGGFEIINNKPASSSSQYKDSSLNKDQVLKDIENPPSKVSFVDHLLANPATPPKPPTPEPPKKSPAIDPYREPIE